MLWKSACARALEARPVAVFVGWLLWSLLASQATLPINAAHAQTQTSLANAITSGTPNLNLRLRYEEVDVDGVSETGNAVTLRTLAGWKTSTWQGLSATAEIINVGRANDDYNDGLNGKVQYPAIPDPDDTDFNRLYLDYQGLPDTRIRGGRQPIQLDNGRFVATNPFRQVLQVFNGISLENRSLANTQLFAAYLGRVKTSLARQHETSTILLNARHALSQDHALTAYGYFQDQPNAIPGAAFQGAAPTDTSHQILGLRATGTQPLDEQWKFVYTLEYATQAVYAGREARIHADFMHLGGGTKFSRYLLRVDYQQLASNNGVYGFQMPLGTRHPFQGWADQFVSTPQQGIRDTYVSGTADIAKAKILAAFHTFKSDTGGVDFGNEFDVGVSYSFIDGLVGKIEYADYQAGDTVSGKVDVKKFWLTLTFNY